MKEELIGNQLSALPQTFQYLRPDKPLEYLFLANFVTHSAPFYTKKFREFVSCPAKGQTQTSTL